MLVRFSVPVYDNWPSKANKKFVLCSLVPVKCGDLQAALDSFEKSLDMAKLQGDELAESAIKKAIADVNKKIVRGVKESGEQDDEEEEDDRHSVKSDKSDRSNRSDRSRKSNGSRGSKNKGN